MEKDMVHRLVNIFGDRVRTRTEISAYGGLVMGRPDFEFDGDPGDCKSVLMDAWIPLNGWLPRKGYYQMQGYMLYAKKSGQWSSKKVEKVGSSRTFG
ncbi:hypothetical protein [Chryseolinea soli]|uniref:Uncharacterized protein n=1 Tax=Chryseolinea soli TaxID=2321403 RepID=A0A385T2C5_9BACT|nr:hypothetical protein [Chryseolinea soli]AYB35308.1 hypothetical protein D4L85_34080 [Chryseolinea soli]